MMGEWLEGGIHTSRGKIGTLGAGRIDGEKRGLERLKSRQDKWVWLEEELIGNVFFIAAIFSPFTNMASYKVGPRQPQYQWLWLG